MQCRKFFFDVQSGSTISQQYLIGLMIDDREIHKMKFSRTAQDRKRESQSAGNSCQALADQLRIVLSSLLQQKQAAQAKMAGERLAFKQQIASKQSTIFALEEQNQKLRMQVEHMRSEVDQKKTLNQFLKKKSSRAQLQRDSLANIINYLEQKNKALNEQIYQLKKMKNLKQRHSNSYIDQHSFLPPYAHQLHRESLLEYTDFVEKDFLSYDLCKTEQCAVEGATETNQEDSERMTIQKPTNYHQLRAPNNLDRIRSIGQIISSPREDTLKLSKGPASKKRSSISKSQVMKLIKQSRVGEKSKRQGKQDSAVLSKEVSVKRYDSS